MSLALYAFTSPGPRLVWGPEMASWLLGSGVLCPLEP